MAKGEGITYDELRGLVSGGTLAPVYLLHGGEEYLAEEAEQFLVSSALKPEERDFNLDLLYGSDVSVVDVVNRASAFPMMAERRVVVLRESEKALVSDKAREQLGAYVDHASPSTCLILRCESPDFRRKPFTALKKGATVVNFPPLKDYQIPRWVAGRIKSLGRQITPEAVELFAGYVSTSLREIQQEIEKIFLYVGDRHSITVEDVRQSTGVSKEFTVFDLQKAVGLRDLPRAMTILDRMLTMGEEMHKISFMLMKYFVALWKLCFLATKGTSQQDQARLAEVNPYFLKEYLEALQKYSRADIERAFRVMAEIDERSKTGGGKPELLLHLLLLEIVGPAREARA